MIEVERTNRFKKEFEVMLKRGKNPQKFKTILFNSSICSFAVRARNAEKICRGCKKPEAAKPLVSALGPGMETT